MGLLFGKLIDGRVGKICVLGEPTDSFLFGFEVLDGKSTISAGCQYKEKRD